MPFVRQDRFDAEYGSQSAFLGEVLLSGPVSRKEIAARLGFNSATVSRLARPLLDAGLVQERPERPGEHPVRPGRRFRPLAIDPRGGQVLGIGVAPTIQTVALADLSRNIIAGTALAIEPIDNPDHVVRRLAQESRRLIGAHLQDRSRLLGGFLMITAVIDPVRGSIIHSPYLGWKEYPARAQLSELLNLPMQVRMLTPSIAQAEMLFGAARGRDNILALLCGLGIGAGVLSNGRPVGDSRFPTGGIGMMETTGEDGTVAPLDDLASGLPVLRHLHGATAASVSPLQADRALFAAIERDRAGDPQVSAPMARAGRELGRLVVQYGHFVRPEIVLIGGPLALSPTYMAAVWEVVVERISPTMEVAASCVTGAQGGFWSSCSMAVWEYLIERPLDLSDMGVLPA